MTPDVRARSRRSGSGAVLSAVAAGVIIGMVEVVFATSFVTLIFAGDLGAHLPSAVGLALFAAAVLMSVVALMGSLPGTIGSIQDVPAAILAVIAAAIAARLPPGDAETFLTVVLAIASSSILVGVFLLILGRLHLGSFVRFVPYPVVGGFLGGTGVLLSQGAFGVFTGSELTIAAVPDLLATEPVLKWLPGLAMAVVLVALLRRGVHFLVVPGLFIVAVALFHVTNAVSGSTIAQAGADGWLLGPFPEGSALWRLWTVDAVVQADWSLLFSQIPALGTLLALSALGLLLNATGVELAFRSDVDLDRELQAVGVANIVSGLGGGFPGYHAVSLSVLAFQMRATTRLVGFVAAAVCAIGILAGAAMLSALPRLAIGGLLLFIGLDLMVTWLYDTWSRLPRQEYALLVLIVAVIAGRGFAAGVLMGLIAAVALFLVSYSRIDVVKDALTGGTYQSNVDRPVADREYLDRQGAHLQIVKLHGFLFFGTAHSLFERVRTRVGAEGQVPLLFLVLDFRRVTGLDSSAAVTFTKISRLAEEHAFTLVLTGLSDALQHKLAHAGLAEDRQPALRMLPDIDHGVQWCEDRLLEHRTAHVTQVIDDDASPWGRNGNGLEFTRLHPYLQRIAVPEGHVLIQQGDEGLELFFLASGQLTASFRQQSGEHATRLRTVGPGSVVGELGLYLGRTRAATVTADSDCTVYRLSEDSLHDLEHDDPELAAHLHRWLAGLMARRVVDNVRTISALLD